MRKDQEEELERLGLELLAEEGENVIFPTVENVRAYNTDGTDLSPEQLSQELEKAEKRRFPALLILLLVIAIGIAIWLVRR